MGPSTWWLLIALFLSPLALPAPSSSVGPSVAVMQAKNTAFITLGLAFALWHLDSWWLRAVLAWSWVGFLAAGSPDWGAWGLLGVLAWALAFQAASRTTACGWAWTERVIASAALLQVAWMACQALGWDPLRTFAPGYALTPVALLGSGGDRPDPSLPPTVQGWFSNQMDAALFLGLSLPALLAVHPILALVTGGALLILPASAGVALAALTGLWWAFRRHWSVGLAASSWLLALGIAFLTYRDVGGLGAKPMAWKAGWALVWTQPWTGYGVNALDHGLILRSHDGRWRWNFLFSDLLQWGVETGVPGLALALAFTAWLGWRVWRTWPAGAELVLPAGLVLALATASIPARIGPVALLAACYLGRLTRLVAPQKG